VGPLLSGFLLRRWLPAQFRLEARHSGRAARFDLTFQLGNTPLAPLNHPPLLQNGGRQLDDDRDENIVVGGGQVNLGIHSPYYDITTSNRARTRQTTFGQFTSPSLNCYDHRNVLTFKTVAFRFPFNRTKPLDNNNPGRTS
jgi:hypothetical protein